MADSKISALPAASLPLSGAELLVVVQGGADVNVAAGNIASGNIFNIATGVTPVATPTGKAICFDTSSGAIWYYSGAAWVRFL